MCVFTSDKDIPLHVRLSTRTLQYLVIPLLSVAILSVGVHHMADCDAQPLLPVWHVVAGASGLLVPVLYLLFDDLSPALAKRCPALSEVFDNLVVFVLPVYIIFEISWLITGTVWVFGIGPSDKCDNTIYIFSIVVIINFWIHVLTPLLFMFCLCSSRLCPFLRCTAPWEAFKSAVQLWTLQFRLLLSGLASLPLGLAMVVFGARALASVAQCPGEHRPFQSRSNSSLAEHQDSNVLVGDNNGSATDSYSREMIPDMFHIPIWLVVAGVLLLLLPVVYYLYDKYCKQAEVSTGAKSISRAVVLIYLLSGLVWAVIGFLWIFGTHTQLSCNLDNSTFKFAYASLICLNVLMDLWICFKICVVLYWALLSDSE